MQVLILAGGVGSRFWPLSRRSRPKQLLALDGERSLLQDTVARLAPLVAPSDVWICTGRELADAVAAQVPEVPRGQILAEPEGRNTAPAIGWSLVAMPQAARDGVVAVLPSDHRVADRAAFRDVLDRARRAVEAEDRVMTLGVTPGWPEPGYGHLELGETLDAGLGVRRVERFIEKPPPADAASYAASGDHLWNAGIFVFRGATMLELLGRFEPEIAAGLEAIRREPARLEELYGELKSISIDYAVMERVDDLATLPIDCGWSDLGSWRALAEELEADDDGNVGHGDTLAVGAGDNLLWAEEGTVAVVGVEGLVVVRTADAVLVVPKERAQEVKALVRELEARGRDDLL